MTLTAKGERYAVEHEGDHVPTWRGLPIPLTREAIEAEIERLVELLDTADGDPDLEETGDEADAAWPEGRSHLGGFVTPGLNEDSEDDGLTEPSLGAPEVTVNVPTVDLFSPSRSNDGSQVHWAKGRGDDDEAVNEDFDEGDQDSGEPIPGGEYGLDEISRLDARTMKAMGYRL